VAHLEALQTVTALGLLAHHVKHRVNELSALSVVTLGPVVTGTSLTKDEVIRAEQLTKRTSTNRVHGTGLEVHENCAGNVTTTSGLVEVDVDALQLEVRVTVVSTGGINAVLVRNHLPELGANLITALTALNVHEFTHWKLDEDFLKLKINVTVAKEEDTSEFFQNVGVLQYLDRRRFDTKIKISCTGRCTHTHT
jgi:hypothetical protein